MTLAEARPINDRLMQYLPTVVAVFNKGAESVVLLGEAGRSDGLVVGMISWHEVAAALSSLTKRHVNFVYQDSNGDVELLNSSLARQAAGSIAVMDENTASRIPQKILVMFTSWML